MSRFKDNRLLTSSLCSDESESVSFMFPLNGQFGCGYEIRKAVSPLGCGSGRPSGQEGSKGDGDGLGAASGLGSVDGFTSGSTVGDSGIAILGCLEQLSVDRRNRSLDGKLTSKPLIGSVVESHSLNIRRSASSYKSGSWGTQRYRLCFEAWCRQVYLNGAPIACCNQLSRS